MDAKADQMPHDRIYTPGDAARFAPPGFPPPGKTDEQSGPLRPGETGRQTYDHQASIPASGGAYPPRAGGESGFGAGHSSGWEYRPATGFENLRPGGVLPPPLDPYGTRDLVPQPTTPPRRSGMVLVISIVLSLIFGSVAGGATALYLFSSSPPQRTEIPQAGGVALPPGASIADLVKAIEPGVASIHIASTRGQGAGTGFLIDTNGNIITNRHVVEGARNVSVDIGGRKNLPGRVLGSSPEIDVAVIKIEPFDKMQPLTLGNSDSLQVGDTVVAVGNALNLPGGPTVTTGIVSAKDRTIVDQDSQGRTIRLTGLIQTDAAINPGNSGGPLINLAGQVVGVNTAAAANPRDQTGTQAAQNIGFAQNINDVKAAAEAIIDGRGVPGSGATAVLGVSTTNVDERVAQRQGLSVDRGVLVVEVVEGSAAEQAGIQPGDVIVSADGRSISSSLELRNAIQAKKPGEKMTFGVVRGVDRLNITATLA